MSIGNFIDTHEAAELLNKSVALVRKFIAQGRIKATRSRSGQLWIDEAEFKKFCKVPRKPGRPKKNA